MRSLETGNQGSPYGKRADQVTQATGVGQVFLAKALAGTTELSSRPERTRISYFALLATTTCAALRRESRMQLINAAGLDRKSGGAQWRDLRFSPGWAS